jgi:intracellular sulfur oxidation DsrE/DsrF family protein
MKNEVVNRKKEENSTKHRRGFLEMLVKGATTLGLLSVVIPIKTKAEPVIPVENFGGDDDWFAKIKGKHRMVFDATQPHGIYPFAWPRVFLISNEATGSNEKECGVVVVLRHTAISYAFENRLWEKYKFGEVFKAEDPATNTPSQRNPFWQPKVGDYSLPGVGNLDIGINELQARGVMFCVCNTAITVFTSAVAQGMKLDAAEVKKDWLKGLLPGIHVVPSGVWAVGRAQEYGCKYCFAG